MDVRTLMRRSVEYHADLPCVGQGATRYTFEQSWTRALRFANWLLSLGLEKGDRVGVLEDNTIESADLFVATALAGLVPVPL